jgi:two-component system OmpR family sensor kinase
VAMLARLKIRLRLTLAFAAAMAFLLAASGLFLYLRVGAALDRTIDQGLRGRADDVAILVRGAGPGLREAVGRRLVEREESFAQVLAPDGAVLDSTPGLGERRLLTGPELGRAARTTVLFDRPPFPDSDDPLRLLATPVEAAGGRPVVVVVGTSTEERAETLASLLGQLLLGGPLTLAAASLLGYLLAAAALRPVESMRREAEAVSAAEPGRRLPLPPADDEISRLGATLNTMLDRLEAALAQERRFVSDASHELRTPLASLRIELELALRRPRPAGELRAALRSAAEETERLSRLAEDLLVLARADGGALPVNPEPVAAARLLAEVGERFAAPAAEAGRAVDVQAEDGLELMVDRLRVSQALGNLVDNALRHGRGRVRLTARRGGGRVELHVHDQGPGFPPGFLDHAFDRFARADPARQGPGAGLGLAIVAVIASAHGGSAHAANLDDGADVWLELPAGPARGAHLRLPQVSHVGRTGRWSSPLDRALEEQDIDGGRTGR